MLTLIFMQTLSQDDCLFLWTRVDRCRLIRPSWRWRRAAFLPESRSNGERVLRLAGKAAVVESCGIAHRVPGMAAGRRTTVAVECASSYRRTYNDDGDGGGLVWLV